MHQQDHRTEVLTRAILRYAVERIRMNPPTLDGPKSEQDLRAMVGQTITADGLGGLEALRILSKRQHRYPVVNATESSP